MNTALEILYTSTVSFLSFRSLYERLSRCVFSLLDKGEGEDLLTRLFSNFSSYGDSFLACANTLILPLHPLQELSN